MGMTAALWAGTPAQGSSGGPPMRAPWETGNGGKLPERASANPDGPTRAPWADQRGSGGR